MFKISTSEAPSYLTETETLTETFPKLLRQEIHTVLVEQWISGLNINLPLPKSDFIKRSFAYAGPKLLKSANSLAASKKDWKILTLMFYYHIDSIVLLCAILFTF